MTVSVRVLVFANSLAICDEIVTVSAGIGLTAPLILATVEAIAMV